MYIKHLPNTYTTRLTNSKHRTVFSLIIINKAGGLIYQREFQPGLRKLSTNDYLVLAGTFHGYVTVTSDDQHQLLKQC
ncbi:hypothetical protein CNMCM6106_009300 [Aspergillus hiratsukae]|uniref:Trafficking protein particle complex subunit n=1 Tax=Aspergillus hiratsukae TaxID=1194566 RepID=A0A8H6V0Z5_9EURO|nr:hypothetical protein CNMCM6106_009300 [Aspergillus hiratsukae]